MKRLRVITLSLLVGFVPLAFLYFWPALPKSIVSTTCVGILPGQSHTAIKVINNSSLDKIAVMSCGITPKYYGLPFSFRGQLFGPSFLMKAAAIPSSNELYVVPLVADWLIFSTIFFVLALKKSKIFYTLLAKKL